MILFNPTDREVSIVYTGAVLSVKSKSTVEVTDEAGQYWLSQHAFLVKNGAKKKEEVVATPIVEKEVEPVVVTKEDKKK
jgi:hypothetical protein